MRLTHGIRFLSLGCLLLVGVSLIAHAQVYRCTAKNGSVAYQDHACAQGQRQALLNLPSHAPSGYVAPAAATSVESPAVDASALPPSMYAPPPPLPMLYACVGAVNGIRYLTQAPPPPYLAPLGVLGYPPQTLSEAYGAPGGAGMSAPELAPKPRVGRPSIGSAMTEVEDACEPATHADVCSFVQRQYGDNHRKLRMAMRNEQPPLRQREQALQDQLRNCG